MSMSEEPKPSHRKMTEEDIQKFENEVLQKPDLKELREKLLFYYFGTRNEDKVRHHTIQCAQFTPWCNSIFIINNVNFPQNPTYRDKVIQILENSLQKYPDEAGVYNNLGHIYEKMAVPPKYETKDYIKWTGVEPEKEKSKRVNKDLFTKAVEYLKKAFSLFTKDTDKCYCLYALGTLYFCNLDYPKALEYHEQAFQYAPVPNQSMITFDIGLTYLFMNKIYEAKEHFQKAIEFDKECFFSTSKITMMANEWLGYIALKEDEIELAKEYLIKSSKVNNDPYIKTSGFPLILARKLMGKGAYKEVKDYCI
jgi:tetratricopeptide (TPR) repeat protein